ncbi:MAG TPA: phage holin family protein [Pseudomonadales bacterium]|nr:phage holin family protein [Pseudomonadales bacterium]
MTNEADSASLTRPSIKRFGAATLGLLSGHVELLGVELQEQKIHGLRALMWTWLALLAGLLLVIGLSALVLMALWDNYRLQAIIGLCAFYTAALLVCLWRLRITLKATSVPFNATRTELARSRDRLMP